MEQDEDASRTSIAASQSTQTSNPSNPAEQGPGQHLDVGMMQMRHLCGGIHWHWIALPLSCANSPSLVHNMALRT